MEQKTKSFFNFLPKNGFICAHRGARSIAPENTLLAMKKAKASRAHCWETDVQLSRDGELIVFHDETLERTTDIQNNDIFREDQALEVGRYTADELRALNSGSWFFRDDPFSTISTGEVAWEEREEICSQKIPLLREILEYTKEHSFPVNIEIKDLKTSAEDITIVDKIIDMLRETHTMELVLLSSFRHEYLQRARELSDDVAIGVLTDGQHPPNLIEYLRSLSAEAYHPEQGLCDLRLLNGLQHAGIRVNLWTVNDTLRAKEMFDAGAGVITDWPQRMVFGES